MSESRGGRAQLVHLAAPPGRGRAAQTWSVRPSPTWMSSLHHTMVSAPGRHASSLIALQPNEDDRYSKMADIGGAVLELFRAAREARINAK